MIDTQLAVTLGQFNGRGSANPGYASSCQALRRCVFSVNQQQG